MIHFILGGARSGKSAIAEALALAAYERDKADACNPANTNSVSGTSAKSTSELFYLATSTPVSPIDNGDDSSPQYEDMRARITAHQASRDSRFHTLEEPLHIADIVRALTSSQILLLDCLTLWLNNCLMQGYDHHTDSVDLAPWHKHKQAFFQSLAPSAGQLIIVSNEVGQGIIPLGKLSRIFVDQAGLLHQELAQRADSVSLVTAGLEQRLK